MEGDEELWEFVRDLACISTISLTTYITGNVDIDYVLSRLQELQEEAGRLWAVHIRESRGT